MGNLFSANIWKLGGKEKSGSHLLLRKSKFCNIRESLIPRVQSRSFPIQCHNRFLFSRAAVAVVTVYCCDPICNLLRTHTAAIKVVMIQMRKRKNDRRLEDAINPIKRVPHRTFCKFNAALFRLFSFFLWSHERSLDERMRNFSLLNSCALFLFPL